MAPVTCICFGEFWLVGQSNYFGFGFRAVLNWVSKVITRLLLLYYALICLQKSRHFLNQWEAKPKPIMPRSHVLSRAWRRLHAFTSSSDWSFVLFTFSVIGQSYYFGFGFTALNWKPLFIEYVSPVWVNSQANSQSTLFLLRTYTLKYSKHSLSNLVRFLHKQFQIHVLENILTISYLV